MKIVKLFSYVMLAVLPLCTMLMPLIQPAATLAADDTEQVLVSAKYPGFAGTNQNYYTFNIDLKYSGGKEARYFDLSASGPDNFTYTINQLSQSSAISTIKLDPGSYWGETVQLKVQPNTQNLASPGDYTIKFQASAGSVKGSIELGIKIDPVYILRLSTSDGARGYLLDASKENPVIFDLDNIGNTSLQNINLTYSIKGDPSGWDVKFDPAPVEIIAAQNTKTVTMNIKPPEKVVPGDYEITVTAKNQPLTVTSSTTVRLTISDSGLPFWLIAGIVLVVVVALVVLLLRFGKRSG